MSKCTKSKRPCKICLTTVNRKTGLQCQGACQSWVHYSCLNYTPGKIRDIKKGIIKVTCPCPDCKTILPKEYRTDQPFSCSNQLCPANRPPKCENPRCPINDSERRAVPKQTCPLSTCGTTCKQHSTPQLPYVNLPRPPMQPCVPVPPQPVAAPADRCLNPSSGCLSTPGGGNASRATADMCQTIGLLTSQLNELMMKMQNYS